MSMAFIMFYRVNVVFNCFDMVDWIEYKYADLSPQSFSVMEYLKLYIIYNQRYKLHYNL